MTRRLVLAGIVVLAIGAFFYFDLARFLSLAALKENRDRLLSFTQTHYAVAAGVFIVTYIAVTGLSLPGAVILTLAGGFLFGGLVGTLLVNVGATTGDALQACTHRFAPALIVVVVAHRQKLDSLPVFGIQHGPTILTNCASDHGFHPGEIFKGIYVLQSEVICGNIQYDTDVAIIKTKTRADDTATGRLEDRDINRGIFQYQLGGNRSRIVALNDLLVSNICPIDRVYPVHPV